MKRMLWVGVCVLLSLTACSASAGVAPAPAPSDIQAEEWATRYPAIYEQWSSSVHGVALLEGNTDAPGCTGCHGDPGTEEMTTALFHLEIPSRCARCHADETVMGKYDIAADTYETFQADYHGATIEYYRAMNPAVMRYEAVCSDCHGSHAIYRPDDTRSSVASANLLATCQQCHSEAPPNFATASIGHFRTTPDASPLVYIIKLFYLILIPVVLGVMLAFIGLDIVHRVHKKPKRQQS